MTATLGDCHPPVWLENDGWADGFQPWLGSMMLQRDIALDRRIEIDGYACGQPLDAGEDCW